MSFTGKAIDDESTLVTPSLNLSGATAVFLDFDSEVLPYNVSSVFEVQVSVDGGATYQRIFHYLGALMDLGEGSYFMHHYLEVPVAASKPNVKFRFYALGGDPGNYRGFWAIDNVRVTANVLKITTIAASGGNVTVTWPGGPGIRLQKTTTLTNPLSWVDIGSTLGNSSHSEALTATPTFFRLSKP